MKYEFLLIIFNLNYQFQFWASLILYFLHGMIFTATFWLLIQLFQLFYSITQLINHRNAGTKLVYYIIGYVVPIIFLISLIALSGNFKLFLQGFQPLQAPIYYFIIGVLAFQMFFHLIFGVFTFYLLKKRFRVGYTPCPTDAETLSEVRKFQSDLIHLAPLVIVTDILSLVTVLFSLYPTNLWLWILVAINIIEALVTLRVLSFKRIIAGKFFYNKKNQMCANDLPKNPLFSPTVQRNLPSGFNVSLYRILFYSNFLVFSLRIRILLIRKIRVPRLEAL